MWSRLGGPNSIMGNCHVVSYTNDWDPAQIDKSKKGPSAVSITLHDGRVYSGDILVGADGIWSKIRRQMVGESEVRALDSTSVWIDMKA
jgi:zeaxanthin epoxidase